MNRGRPLSRTASVAALTASMLALAACESAGGGSATGATTPGPQPAARVGAAGSDCEMPVTFGIAESWKPKAVTVGPDDPLAELARRGPLTMVCEIDAKPAGSIGFLRVWTGAKGELRAALQAFIGAEAQEPAFTESRIQDLAVLEVVYQEKDPLDDSLGQERAFAVETAAGIAAVSLESFDDEEHKSMLPAYDLAKSTLTLS